MQILPPASRPGKRLYGSANLAGWLKEGPIGATARVNSAEMRPVRAILFDKTPEANWALGWHQDRTIAVRERIEVPGFEHWNQKVGAVHVEPPFEFIERMLTLRIHLDAIIEDNAPLLVAPGSHRMGRIPENRIDAVVSECGSFACLAQVGDVWAYRTPILHASERIASAARRRVLQVDFSADHLPGGLDWLGID